MAFTYNRIKLEPVDFGDFTSQPVVTAESRLRLSQMELKADNLEDYAETLANCFGNDAEKVLSVLKENPILTEYARLQVYLLRGDAGIKDLEAFTQKFMENQAAKASKAKLNEGADANA